jgi:predicted GNAT family N-acyltransferase
MAIKQIMHGSKEYDQMLKLRYEILRKPLGLTITPEDIEQEKKDTLIASFDDDEMLGCCILTKMDEQTVRLRQMAVQRNQQGKGIGEAIIHFTENVARDKGFKVLMMHARDTAIGFYERFGYSVRGEQFTEVNIQHHAMEKRL